MYKVALITVTLNPPYWPYLGPMTQSAKKFFLNGHQVDFITWSDISGTDDEITRKIFQSWQGRGFDINNPHQRADLQAKVNTTLEEIKTLKIIPTEPFDWPLPTLHRYHLFLREEELLKEYDYIFYCDTDMDFVSKVGDEILGEGLTGAQHPMYALAPEFIPPYEPNPASASYIPRPGQIVQKGDKKKFQPLYFAGGFQGGRTDDFLKAMKEMKELVNQDVEKGYFPIWNDESVWNYYMFKNPPSVVLNPSYVYPDSLNKVYYQRVWGRQYVPRIITITKPFSLTKQAGLDVQQRLPTL